MKKVVFLAFVLVLLLTAMVVRFVRPVEADWTWTETIYIRADGSVEPATPPISTVDNITYTLTDNIVSDIPDFTSAIVVERDNIVVDGASFTLRGVEEGYGIFLGNRNNVTLKNVKVTDFRWGIYLNYSSNNNLIGNTLSNNSDGIRFRESSNNTLTGNTVSNNSDGIFIYLCNNNVLSGNNFSNNSWTGIYLGSSSNNILTGNTASNNADVGIGLSDSSSNVLTGNTASNNWDGIYLSSSSNNTLADNTAYNNSYGGIHLYDSSGNVLTGNTASNNDQGIRLYDSSNNVLSGNTILNNGNGIILGIYLTDSSNNTLFHSNFINNTFSANVTTGYVNTWDNGFEGNYWSDYNGTDSDNDGIGNTPYIIGANNTDNYPLMGMFSDFEATSEHNVQIICNSTVSDFLFEYFTPSEIKVISFDVMGEAGTTGFCRICIPTALMHEPYTVLVNGTEVSYNLLPFSNETHSYLYFTYSHSTQEVIIIPEFPVWVSMLLILIILTVAIVFYKRRLLKTPNH